MELNALSAMDWRWAPADGAISPRALEATYSDARAPIYEQDFLVPLAANCYFTRWAASGTSEISAASISNRILQEIPAGSRKSGLGSDRRTPNVRLAASRTRSTVFTVAV